MQMQLALHQDARPASLCDRMEGYFRERPGQWIAGKLLSQTFGYGGWRTRISDLRLHRQMDIRVHVEQAKGSRIKTSAYCYLPDGSHS